MIEIEKLLAFATQFQPSMGWEKFADPKCEKCSGRGSIFCHDCIPSGPWVCSCCRKDKETKYSPLGKGNKEIVFSNGSNIYGYHYWSEHSDPLTISAPFIENFEAECDLSFGFLSGRYIFYCRTKKELLETCEKMTKNQFDVQFDKRWPKIILR